MGICNRVQLITYPDSFGGSIAEMERLLVTHFDGALGGVHILPFYPSSGDRGFAPLTYREVDDRFGSWDEVSSIGRSWDLVADFMVNHLSRRSQEFQDFLSRKEDSPYRDLFIRFKEFWPKGEPAEGDLEKIYTRKPRPPYSEETFADGTTEKVWCTFDYEQIDLNLDTPTGKEFVEKQLQFLADRGVSMIRLDAFAYATKAPGTNCFFLEPEVWTLLDWINRIAAGRGVDILPEVHEHYTMQLKIAEHGYWVYDFALPMLMLQAIYDRDASNLKNWLSICPKKQVTTLDTHDGIGVVDVRDLMSDEEIDRTKENLFTYGANVKKIFNTPEYNNLDIYQINCTYYSALGNRDDWYLLARAIQFFAPGIPQVYYVGMLAGSNDLELVEKTKVGRNINRHNYSSIEVEEAAGRPVVCQLRELMRFRNSHPAFDGSFHLGETGDRQLFITWEAGDVGARLDVDFETLSFTIGYTDPETGVWEELKLGDEE